MLALIATIVLQWGLWLLWRPGESPILLFIFAYQWLQASTTIFLANWRGIDINLTAVGAGWGPYKVYGVDIWLATLLSLLGLVALALGMRLGAGPQRPQIAELVRNALLRYEPKFWFQIYAVALLIATFVESFAHVIPGLSQPLLALVSLKWAFYWTLTCATFVRADTTRRYWLLAFCLELFLGLGGFFSGFQTVLIVTLLGIVAAGVRLSPGRWIALLCLGAFTLYLALTWTAVKVDYRDFVSGGARTQEVVVGRAERMEKLYELVSALDRRALGKAAESLAERVGYVNFFAAVIKRVPRVLPHEGGALWWDSVTRPFMPRIFFPDKTSIEDSQRTQHYTGLKVAGMEYGTSISIGYMGESYIDFGKVGMLLPIFALGWLLGAFYRWTLTQTYSSKAVGMGVATAALFSAALLETSVTKLMGGLAVTMLVSCLLIRFVVPRYFPKLAA
jgi:hypothetical protein